jgi:hypothetical protein
MAKVLNMEINVAINKEIACTASFYRYSAWTKWRKRDAETAVGVQFQLTK